MRLTPHVCLSDSTFVPHPRQMFLVLRVPDATGGRGGVVEPGGADYSLATGYCDRAPALFLSPLFFPAAFACLSTT